MAGAVFSGERKIAKAGDMLAEDAALEVRGKADALATAIYAKSYARNPEFYAFYRSLQAYERSLGKDGDILVVSPDGEFFKYLKDPGRR